MVNTKQDDDPLRGDPNSEDSKAILDLLHPRIPRHRAE